MPCCYSTNLSTKANNFRQEEGNPLDASPANPEVSKQRPMQEGGAESSAGSDKQSGTKASSGHGSPQKGKKV